MASGGEVKNETISKNEGKDDAPHTESSQQNKLLKAFGKMTYCLEIPSDTRPCDIVSACFMDDGTIILADKENKKVLWLVAFGRGTIRNYLLLSDYPCQVCVVNEQKVAVTIPFSQEVQLISMERGMKVTSKVKLGIMCRGIAYARGNYYVSDALDTIHVYRLSGKKDRTISLWEPNKEDSGVNHLAITKDASRIYVANGKNGLIVLDNTGNVVRKFNGPELKYAHSCYVMENGNVLVSGANSNNVVQLTRDGELIGEVIGTKEGVWGVYAVCCDKENSKLCISRYCQSDILVYVIAYNLLYYSTLNQLT